MRARLFRRFVRAREPAPEPAKLVQHAPVDRASDAQGADDAELDALRGELVRELNRLAERTRSVD